jgi:ribosomal protein S27AE
MNIDDCYTIADVIVKLKLPVNGQSYKKANNFIKENNLSTSHFDQKRKNRKYQKIKIQCPVCGKVFETLNDKKQKIVCSKACANTYFRSGENNPNYKGSESYRSICFKYHKKECIICGEKTIVAVHHFNEDHNDNNPRNLIPLCPTHHQYMHSKHKKLIIDKVKKYISQIEL